MQAFRIGSAKHAGTAATAFNGQGSLNGDGRWHHRGHLIVYSSEHLSLAALEILVHFGRRDQIQPYVFWELDIPDPMIGPPPALPGNWRDDIELTRNWGDQWLFRHATPAVRVPSAVVPTEFNVLLNPVHQHFSLKWVMKGPNPVTFDPRLLGRIAK